MIPAHRTKVTVTLPLDAANVRGSNADLYRPVTRFILAHRVPMLARTLQPASYRFTSGFLITWPS